MKYKVKETYPDVCAYREQCTRSELLSSPNRVNACLEVLVIM